MVLVRNRAHSHVLVCPDLPGSTFAISRFWTIRASRGEVPGRLRESRNRSIVKSGKKCFGTIRGPIPIVKTQEKFPKWRQNAGVSAICQTYHMNLQYEPGPRFAPRHFVQLFVTCPVWLSRKLVRAPRRRQYTICKKVANFPKRGSVGIFTRKPPQRRFLKVVFPEYGAGTGRRSRLASALENRGFSRGIS